MTTKPFWESAYTSGDETATFGSPSKEIVELASILPTGARVLDIGCGDGRNALYLARLGFDVTAVDISATGIEKLSRLADDAGVMVSAHVADMRDYRIDEEYDLMIAHGCLHLIERDAWARVIERMQEHTRPGGYDVIAVFTDKLPAPPDLEPFMLGLFTEGELFELYDEWEIIEQRSYILEDEHPGGIRHRHPIDKVVARRR